MNKKEHLLKTENHKRIIENIIKIQAIEGLEVGETLQKKMFEILEGTTDAKTLIEACVNKYADI